MSAGTGRGPRGEGIITLADLKPGNKAMVSRLHPADRQAVTKAIAMGLLPGVEIELVRRSPSFVFKSGQSRFALDAELARQIYVDPL